jgi:hypothetical protein
MKIAIHDNRTSEEPSKRCTCQNFYLIAFKRMVLLFRFILPIIWKIDPRLWTGWTEMGQIAIMGGFVQVMPKAKPFTRLKIMPLSGNLVQFSFSILKVCQQACINLKDSKAHWDHVRKCITCETAKLFL